MADLVASMPDEDIYALPSSPEPYKLGLVGEIVGTETYQDSSIQPGTVYLE
jgi:hypothetical protein